jgi:hypothetical protein
VGKFPTKKWRESSYKLKTLLSPGISIDCCLETATELGFESWKSILRPTRVTCNCRQLLSETSLNLSKY